MQAVTVNVGTGSAVKLVGIGSVIGGAGSQNVKIRNDGPTNSLFIGGSSAVTSGNGFAVPVGTTVDLGNPPDRCLGDRRHRRRQRPNPRAVGPRRPNRSTPMTLVDQHPRVQAADHALADLAKRRADFEARVRPIAEEDAKAERVYNQALEDALLRGGPMPAPLVRQLPELADVEVRHRFLFEQQQLNEERQRAVAAAFPDVLEQARAMATELAVAAQAPLQQLLTAMGEVGTLLQAVRVCRDAANAEARDRNDGTGRTQFNDFPLTVERIIQVIATAGDPIDLIDLGGRREIRGLNTGMTVGDVRQLLGTRA